MNNCPGKRGKAEKIDHLDSCTKKTNNILHLFMKSLKYKLIHKYNLYDEHSNDVIMNVEFIIMSKFL